MAKNIFVHGDFKRLREEMRRYKKDEQRLAQRFQTYNCDEKNFSSSRLVALSALYFPSTTIVSDETADFAGTGKGTP